MPGARERQWNRMRTLLVAAPIASRAAMQPVWASASDNRVSVVHAVAPFVRAVRSVCWMPVEPASAIVHALKYAGWTKVAEGMGERMSRLSWPRDVVEERAALVPIPLSPARIRERGYNQSELLALALSARWRVPVLASAVVRSRVTRSQTELTPEQRVGNVAGSFQLVGRERDTIGGRHLVLVDDVVTTAATLNECASVL